MTTENETTNEQTQTPPEKPTIIVRREGKRLCGFRKGGALYMVCGTPMAPCCKLPVPLDVCPCCGEGIRPSRAMRWLKEPEKLWEGKTCTNTVTGPLCPLRDDNTLGDTLMLWIGEKYYPTPVEFIREGIQQGISRRITVVPKGFVIGETWVLLAHRKAVPPAPPQFGEEPGEWTPGLFSAFRPTAIEYIVKDDDSDEKLLKLQKRGITLIRVERVEDETPKVDALPGLIDE